MFLINLFYNLFCTLFILTYLQSPLVIFCTILFLNFYVASIDYVLVSIRRSE